MVPLVRKMSRPPGRSTRAASGTQSRGSAHRHAPYSEIARSKLASAKRQPLGVHLVQRKRQVVAAACSRRAVASCSRGDVDADGTGAAPGKPGRHVGGAAAELDRVACRSRSSGSTCASDSGMPQMPQFGSSAAQLRSPGATKSAAHWFQAATLRLTWSVGRGWSAVVAPVVVAHRSLLGSAATTASPPIGPARPQARSPSASLVQQARRLDPDARADEVGGRVVERRVLVQVVALAAPPWRRPPRSRSAR